MAGLFSWGNTLINKHFNSCRNIMGRLSELNCVCLPLAVCVSPQLSVCVPLTCVCVCVCPLSCVCDSQLCVCPLSCMRVSPQLRVCPHSCVPLAVCCVQVRHSLKNNVFKLFNRKKKEKKRKQRCHCVFYMQLWIAFIAYYSYNTKYIFK